MAGPALAAGLVAGVVATAGFVVVLGSAGWTSSAPSLTLDTSAVPDPALVPWLEAAGSLCPDVSAALLAAQIDQESGWDPDDVSSAGAEGISQFMPSTWPSWDEPPAVPGPDTPFVAPDAIMAQGRYDCALAALVAPIAASTGVDIISLTLAAYNAGPAAVVAANGIPDLPQTEAYVAAVLADLPIYADELTSPGGDAFDQAEITAAEKYLGTPYSWGGGNYYGPSLGSGSGADTVGFDCSGLVMYAVFQASGGTIELPHLSEAQVTMGMAVTTGTGAQVLASGLLQPGDVIGFYNLDNDGQWDHIGIYIGSGDMIDAPDTGSFVRIDDLTTSYWATVQWDVRSFG